MISYLLVTVTLALAIVNAQSGETAASSAMTSDVDDLYYDSGSGRLYVSGGGGAIDVFEQKVNGLRHISPYPHP